MEYRRLGASGFMVPALSFGAGTFGGKGPLFSAWGSTDVEEARRLLDICLDAGVTMFDTADVYSSGASETILGQAIKGRRDKALISTKATFRFNDDPNAVGSSRQHLLRTCDEALARLGTDYIDLFQPRRPRLVVDSGPDRPPRQGQRRDADPYWHQRGFAERNPPPV